MCNNLILDILNIQKDTTDLLKVIKKFTPLLLRYSQKLQYEDSFYDLQLVLIQTLISINVKMFENDFGLLAYLKKTVYTAYIKISKKHEKDSSMIRFYNQMEHKEIEMIENKYSKYDDYSLIELSELANQLTKKEYSTIYRYFIKNYSILQIAKQDKISRQAANKNKVRALRKIIKYYEQEL